MYRVYQHRNVFRKGANLSLFVGFCSILSGHLGSEGARSTNQAPDCVYSWLVFLEIWTGTLPKAVPMLVDSVHLIISYATAIYQVSAPPHPPTSRPRAPAEHGKAFRSLQEPAHDGTSIGSPANMDIIGPSQHWVASATI